MIGYVKHGHTWDTKVTMKCSALDCATTLTLDNVLLYCFREKLNTIYAILYTIYYVYVFDYLFVF